MLAGLHGTRPVQIRPRESGCLANPSRQLCQCRRMPVELHEDHGRGFESRPALHFGPVAQWVEYDAFHHFLSPTLIDLKVLYYGTEF